MLKWVDTTVERGKTEKTIKYMKAGDQVQAVTKPPWSPKNMKVRDKDQKFLSAVSSTSFQYFVGEPMDTHTSTPPYSTLDSGLGNSTSTPGPGLVKEKLLSVSGACISPFSFQLSPLDTSSALTSENSISSKLDLGNSTESVLKQRPGHISSLLSVSNLMVSLPCLLRFPLALSSHGGAAFLVCYIIILTLTGYPLLYTQWNLSTEERKSPAVLWTKLVPVGGGIGTGLVTLSLLLAVQYSVYTSYSFLYLASSLHTPLPWTQCSQGWGANSYCAPDHQFSHHVRNTSDPDVWCWLYDHAGSSCAVHKESSSQQFWERYILRKDHAGLRVLGDLGNVNQPLAGTLVGFWITCMAFFLASSESALRKLRAGLLLSVLGLAVGLVSKGLAVSGSLASAAKVFHPKWDSLGDIRCWVEAAILSCLGPNIHTGAVQALASRKSSSNDQSLLLAFSLLLHICVCLLFSAATLPLVSQHEVETFSALGHFPLVSISQALGKQSGSDFWCHVLFLLVLLLGLLSVINALSVPMSSMQDFAASLLSLKRVLPVLFLFLLLLLTSMSCSHSTGPNVLVLLQRWATDLPVLILAAGTAVLISWLYGMKNIVGSLPHLYPAFVRYLKLCCCLTPLFLLYLSLSNISHSTFLSPILATFPPWSRQLGWLLAGASLSQLPLVALVSLFQAIRWGGWKSLVGKKKEDEKLFDRKGLTSTYQNFGSDLNINSLITTPYKSPSCGEAVQKRTPYKF